MENTPELRSKLERLVKYTKMIINHAGPAENLKSEYNIIHDDWISLKEILPNWKQIQFTNNDFQDCAGMFIKFSSTCKTNMQTIKAICEDTLAEIKIKFENQISDNDKAEYLNKTSHSDSWGKLGVISTIIFGIAALCCPISYKQGELSASRIYNISKEKLEFTKDSIVEENSKLIDSLESYKIKIRDLEKTICKIKRTCE